MRMRGKILVLTATLLQLTCSPVSAIDRDGALKSLRRSHFSLSKNSTGVERGSIEQQDAIDIQPSLLESLRPLLLKGRFSRHASHMSRSRAHSPLEDQDLTPAEEELLDSLLREGPPLYDTYELVLARLAEDISWLAEIPAFWKITIYNKGGDANPVPAVEGRELNVIELPNVGKEAHSYIYHVAARYNDLADYTVFSQASPFVHSPNFVDLMKNPHLYHPVQCLSLQYISEGYSDHVTPTEVVQTYKKHEWYRAERLSLRTLDSVYYNDKGSAYLGWEYHELHHLPPGTNIIAHFLSRIGLPGWIPNEREVGTFAYAGFVGVEKSKVVQHPLQVYENLIKVLLESPVHPFVMEKVYMMLFGGPDVHD